jgi:ParB-like chromosome segregation protein Spo0J
MKIKTVNLTQIKPYWRNPRKNDQSVPLVKASIEKYGYNQPIAVDEDGVIVAGHTRYQALKQLKMKSIQVVVLEGLTEKQLKAYRIADNKAGERSTWDLKTLIPELRELDLGEMQGFFVEDLERMLAQAAGDMIHDVQQDFFDELDARNEVSQANLIRSRNEGKVEFPCPHCGGEIIMNKSDLP